MVLALVVLLLGARPAQPARPLEARDLAEYRLTADVFERFARATELIAARTRDDPRYADAPIFSRDITVTGDALEMAVALETRLDGDPVLSGALFAAEIDSREYTKFALALFAARLAHGFVRSGAMRRVPAGVAADNVAFVAAHEARIAALLRALRLE